MKTNTEKLIETAISFLDEDASPKNRAPKELSCAEGVSNILQHVFPDFPDDIISTDALLATLKKDKRFVATLTPKRGCIVISPRTTTVYGHTGIFITGERIASNDSKTGKFKGNYSWDSWIKEFIKKRGLRSVLFELID